MTTTEKRELLIAFQRYWNLNRYDKDNILGIDINKFLSTLPDDGEKADEDVEQLAKKYVESDIKKNQLYGQFYQTFIAGYKSAKQSNPNSQ